MPKASEEEAAEAESLEGPPTQVGETAVVVPNMLSDSDAESLGAPSTQIYSSPCTRPSTPIHHDIPPYHPVSMSYTYDPNLPHQDLANTHIAFHHHMHLHMIVVGATIAHIALCVSTNASSVKIPSVQWFGCDMCGFK